MVLFVSRRFCIVVFTLAAAFAVATFFCFGGGAWSFSQMVFTVSASVTVTPFAMARGVSLALVYARQGLFSTLKFPNTRAFIMSQILSLVVVDLMSTTPIFFAAATSSGLGKRVHNFLETFTLFLFKLYVMLDTFLFDATTFFCFFFTILLALPPDGTMSPNTYNCVARSTPML